MDDTLSNLDNQKSPKTPKPKNYKPSQSPTAVLIAGTLSSPQTIWPSQDVYDGVTWDYTSPMRQELRSAKIHGKTNVTELLQYVNDQKEQQKQDNDKISLLETWMSVNLQSITPIQKKKSSDRGSSKKNNIQNKRARYLAKELEELTEAVDKNDLIKQVKSRSCFWANNCDNLKTTEHNSSVIESPLSPTKGELSAEELWENANESFLIEATQLVERLEDNFSSKNNLLSSVCKKSKGFKNDIMNQNIPTPNKSTDHNLPQEPEMNFKKCDEKDEFWESDSSLEEIISSLQEDQLIMPGITSLPDNVQNKSEYSSIDLFTIDENDTLEATTHVKNELKNANVNIKNSIENRTTEQISKNNTKENGVLINGTSPEMKSKLFQIKISKKCTPEEIAKKREEAMKRRQKNIKKVR
ncbi:uncharacterized protein PF3D7_1120000-like [Centruroides vittatus]|uniref:uncharacterized protein PF3D7_1120000-like n=1 Tax=Centruroides vittatus TaxID=120091 RepID=UPI00350F6635